MKQHPQRQSSGYKQSVVEGVCAEVWSEIARIWWVLYWDTCSRICFVLLVL